MTTNEQVRAWRIRNPEKVKAQRQRYWEKNKHRYKEWPSSSRDVRNAANRRWKIKHPHKVRESNQRAHRRRCELVTNTYVRNHWASKWGIRNAPEELLETASIIIKLKRIIKLCHHQKT